MSCPRLKRIVIVLAGAAVAAGSVTGVASSGRSSPAPAAARAVQETPQDPEEFRLTDREQVGEEGQRVSVGETQLIFNSIFEFTDTVNDLFVWAWMPTISGQIADNAFIGGQKVEVTPDAQIGGDLFIFAQSGRIDGRLGGDVYAFVAEMVVGERGVIDGAMFGSSGTLIIDGEVVGPVRYAGGVVTINGRVRGDVRLEAGELTLGPSASIEGDLRYESAREATIDPAAQVTGEIVYYAPRDDDDEEGAPAPASAGWFSLWSFLWDAWWLLSSFLVGAIALAFGGESARRPAARLVREPALGLGFGFVIAVVFPAAAILAMVLLVTIPLGLIGLAVYAAAAYLARLVAAQAIGDRVLSLARQDRESSPYASLAVGLLLFYFLVKIPYVGFLIWLAAIVAGLGGMYLATRRPGNPDAQAPPAVAAVT